MQIEIVRTCRVSGKIANEGDICDVPDAIGIDLVNMKKAVPSEKSKKKTNRAVGLNKKSAGALVGRGKK